jgi:hypothetical protein
MKKANTILIGVILGFISFSSYADIPLAIKAAFKRKFPLAEKVKWESGIGQFAAEFKLEKKAIAALFDDSGNLIETEENIGMAELPLAVQESVKLKYPGKKLKDLKKVIRNKNQHLFKIKINGSQVFFDVNGLEIPQEKTTDTYSEISE